MLHKKKVIIGIILSLAVITIGAVAVLINANPKPTLIAPDTKKPSKIQNTSKDSQMNQQELSSEQLKLRTEYYYLLKDLDNMRFFSDFPLSENIPVEELLLFGYMKALEAGWQDDSGAVKLANVNTFTEKHFNRTLMSNIDTSYFTYDANGDSYIPTGWDFHGSDPHYLARISNNPDGSVTAIFDVYLFGESDILDNKSPEEYISDTSLIPPELKHLQAESSFYRKAYNGKTYLQMLSYKRLYDEAKNPIATKADASKSIPYCPDEYLCDDEFVFANGVRLGMSYEKVIEILGGYDEAFDNAPDVKSIIKDGCHYGFYQINDKYTNQSDLKTDGVFQLLNLSSESYQGEFPRGIRIGDSIKDVLNKFPGKDKQLRKWAHQTIYGKDEIGSPRAYLQFTMYNECYRFLATTSRQVLIINFDKKNQVCSVELHKEDS